MRAHMDGQTGVYMGQDIGARHACYIRAVRLCYMRRIYAGVYIHMTGHVESIEDAENKIKEIKKFL